MSMSELRILILHRLKPTNWYVNEVRVAFYSDRA
jgi:hypothetical protein